MKVEQLRSELRKLELPTKGKKAELVARLLEAQPPALSVADDGPAPTPRGRTDDPLHSPPSSPRSPREGSREAVGGSSVEEQTLAMKQTDTVWNCCATGDLVRMQEIVRANPETAWERGAVGELPIHLCCLLRKHELVYWLIEFDPTLAHAVYEGEPYGGENCLHIAIVNKDHKMARRLARQFPALMRQAATGAFFRDGAALTPGSVDTPCYYGEFALHFAAATNQPQLFEALLAIDNEAIHLTDSLGNTVLHLCTLHEHDNMYDFVCDRYEGVLAVAKAEGGEPAAAAAARTPLEKVHNNKDQTPLVLAAQRGSRLMFEHVLERAKQVQWSYGPVTCLLYPLEELDLIPGSPEGALECIVDQEHHHLLEVPRVIDLLTKKWETFGRRIFFQNFVKTLLFMVLFSICTVYRSYEGLHYGNATRRHVAAATSAAMQGEFGAWGGKGSGSGALGEFSQLFAAGRATVVLACSSTPTEIHWAAVQGCLLALGDLIIYIGAFYKLKREIGELRQEGFDGYFGCAGAAFVENFCSLFFCSGVMLTVLMRCGMGSFQDESFVLCICSIIGWMYMLFFLLGHPLTGPIVVMMHKMFMQDVLLFMLIYGVFVLGFAQAFYVEFEEAGWKAFGIRIQKCFATMLGEVEFDEYTGSKHPVLATFLITIYIVVISVMLLNLLIAMMGDTYSKIVDEAQQIWQLEQARILFSIENEMSKSERELELAGYQINIGGDLFVQVSLPRRRVLCLRPTHPLPPPVAPASQVYKVDEKHFYSKWCSCNILHSRCKKCNPGLDLDSLSDDE